MSAVRMLEEFTNAYRLVKTTWQNVPVYTLKKACPILKTESGATRTIELFDGTKLTITITEQ